MDTLRNKQMTKKRMAKSLVVVFVLALMISSASGRASGKRVVRGQSTTSTTETPTTTTEEKVQEDLESHRAARRESDIRDSTGVGGYALGGGGGGGGGIENNFQVPKSLCSACEQFPWTPVAGAEYTRNNGPSFAQQQQNQGQNQQVFQQTTGPGGSGGYDLLPSANRKPFAISADGAGGGQNAIPIPPSAQASSSSFSTGSAAFANPVPQYGPPSILQPANLVNLAQYSRPPQFQPQNVQQHSQSGAFPASGPSQQFRPTVLQPVSSAYGIPQQQQQQQQQSQAGPGPSGSQQIIHGTNNNNGNGNNLQIQTVEPAQLIYQEHSQQQQHQQQQQGNLVSGIPNNQYGPPPPSPPNNGARPGRPIPPQNFRIPIIPRPFQGRPSNQIKFPPRLNFPKNQQPPGAGRFVNRPLQLGPSFLSRPAVTPHFVGYNGPSSVVVQSSLSFPPTAPQQSPPSAPAGAPNANGEQIAPAGPQYEAPPQQQLQNTPLSPPPSGPQILSVGPPPLLQPPQQQPPKNVPLPPPSPGYQTQFFQDAPGSVRPPQGVHSLPQSLQNVPLGPQSHSNVPLAPRPQQNALFTSPPLQNYRPSPPPQGGVPLRPPAMQDASSQLPPPTGPLSIPAQPLVQTEPLPQTPSPPSGQYLPPQGEQQPYLEQSPPPSPPQQPAPAPQSPPFELPAQAPPPPPPPPSGHYLPPQAPQEGFAPQLSQHQLPHVQNAPTPPPVVPYDSVTNVQGNEPPPPQQNAPPPPAPPSSPIQSAGYEPAVPPPPHPPPSAPQYLPPQQPSFPFGNGPLPEGMREMRPPPPPPHQVGVIAPIFINSGSLFPQPPRRPFLFPSNQFRPPAAQEPQQQFPPNGQSPQDQQQFLPNGHPPQDQQQFPQNVHQSQDQQQIIIHGQQENSDNLIQNEPQPVAQQQSQQLFPQQFQNAGIQYEAIPQHMIQMFPPPQFQGPVNFPPQFPPQLAGHQAPHGQNVNYDNGRPVPGILVSSFETNSLPGPVPLLATPQAADNSLNEPIQAPVFNSLESVPAGPQSTTPNPYRVEVRGQKPSGSVQVEYLQATNIDTQNSAESASNSQEETGGKQEMTEDRNFLPSPQIVPFSPQISTIVHHQQAKGSNDIEQGSAQELDDQMRVSGAITNDESIISRPTPPKVIGNGNWEIIPATQYDISHLFNNPRPNGTPSSAPSQPPPQRQYGAQSTNEEQVSMSQVNPTVETQGYESQENQDNIPPASINFSPIIDHDTQAEQSSHATQDQFSSGGSTGFDQSTEQETSQEQQYTPQQTQSQHIPTAPENVLPSDLNEEQNQVTGESSIQGYPTNPASPSSSTENQGPISVGIPIVDSEVPPPASHQQFDPMPPAVVNALQHAQRTSFLTHTHLGEDTSQSGTVYIQSVPVTEGGGDSNNNNNSNDDSNNVVSSNADIVQMAPARTSVLESRENGIVVTNALRVDGASPGATVITPFNCSGGHMAFEVGQDGQTIVRAYPVKAHPGFYYPTPQSSVYWAEQPSATSDSQVTHPDEANPSPSPSSSQTSYSTPVFGWSPHLVSTSNAVVAGESSNQITEEAEVKQLQQQFSASVVSGTVASFEQSASKDEQTSSSSTTATSSGTTTKPSIFSRRPSFNRPSYFRPTVSPLTMTTSSKYMASSDGNYFMKTFSKMKMPKTVQGSTGGSNFASSADGGGTTEIPAIAISSTYGTTTTATLYLPPTAGGKKESAGRKNGKPDKIRLTVGTRFNAGGIPVSSSVIQPSSSSASSSPSEASTSSQDVSAASGKGALFPILDGQSTSPVVVDSSDGISSAVPTDPTTLGTGTKYGEKIQVKLSTTGVQRPNVIYPPVAEDPLSADPDSSSSLHVGKKRNPSSSAFFPNNEEMAFVSSHNSLLSPSEESASSSSPPKPSFSRLTVSSSTTASPPTNSSPKMIMKVIKTVRVKQRMQQLPGGIGGIIAPTNGTLSPGGRRNRFTGRVRVVQRPVVRSQGVEREEEKSSPDSALPEGESLGKEEEAEVKNALIDLKKVPV